MNIFVKTLLALMFAALLGMLVSCEAAEKMVRNAVAAELSARAPESAKAADTDKSGTTDWDEWKAYILSGAGGLALIAEILRRKINATQKETELLLEPVRRNVDVAHQRIDRRVRKPDSSE